MPTRLPRLLGACVLAIFSAFAVAQDDGRKAFVEAMAPGGGHRPVIALLALNEGTEITDLMLPHALLRRADVAEVRIVAPRAGAVQLYPALRIEGALDFDAFAKAHPDGPDYVIVPAMVREDDPAITAWLAQQARRGARIVGVCVGGVVVGHAGLLDGRRFVTHWYSRDDIAKRHPTARFVPDRRYVADGRIATTTGISASLPAMLALVEAIGGRERAQALADEVGLASWEPTHESAQFGLSFSRGASYLLDKAAFWRSERWQVDVRDGMDDIALALATDAWVRTGHIEVEAASASPRVVLRSGLVLSTQSPDADKGRLPLDASLKPVHQLDRSLCAIARKFGEKHSEWVMQEMEYPGSLAACPRMPQTP